MSDLRTTTVATHFPVAVLVEFQVIHDNRWTDGRWTVAGVIAGEQLSAEGVSCRLVHSGKAGQQYLWTGLSISLHRDDAESYYCNLMSDNPSVFVICSTDQDVAMKPSIVTLSYGEATSYMETDVRVERTTMPAELYRALEQYVLENYVPEKRKKRKRDDWKEVEGGRR